MQDQGVEEDVVDNSSGKILACIHRTNPRSYDWTGGFKMTVTLHKQMVDLIEESGLRGMTLNVRLPDSS